MLKTHIINKIALRFRRWSRNAYAVFFSLGKCISIGNLKKSIVEASLPKGVTVIFSTNFSQVKEGISEEIDDPDLLFSLIDSLYLNILQASSQKKLAYATYNKIEFYNNKIAYCLSA